VAEERKQPDGHTTLLARFLWQRTRKILPVFLFVFVSVALALYFLENDKPDTKFTSIKDAFWFCVVTMSTVGYGDIFPVTGIGRIVAGGFILFTLGTVGLIITAVSEAVMEVKRMEESGLIGTRMVGHVIVCGFNSMARASLLELISADRKVALLCETHDELVAAREKLKPSPNLFITAGEPTQEVFGDRMNGAAAEAYIIAMSDDAKNLIAALNVKVVSPRARLVVALQREELRQTLKAGGVTYIASPNELSGRLVASAAFEPEVALLLEDLMSGDVGDSDMMQYQAGELAGGTIGDVRTKMQELDGPLLVGIAKADGGGYRIVANPRGDTRVEAGDHLIVLSSGDQASRFETRYKLRQGR
jgi:voltage-gated potassium channel